MAPSGTRCRCTVAYQDACHLAHAQGVREQPRRLLRGIPGVELRELTEAEICCGSAGTYNLLHPEPARELGERKARAVLATGAGRHGDGQPRLLDAGRDDASPAWASGCRSPTPCRCSTRRSQALLWRVSLASALDGPGTVVSSGTSAPART